MFKITHTRISEDEGWTSKLRTSLNNRPSIPHVHKKTSPKVLETFPNFSVDTFFLRKISALQLRFNDARRSLGASMMGLQATDWLERATSIGNFTIQLLPPLLAVPNEGVTFIYFAYQWGGFVSFLGEFVASNSTDNGTGLLVNRTRRIRFAVNFLKNEEDLLEWKRLILWGCKFAR